MSDFGGMFEQKSDTQQLIEALQSFESSLSLDKKENKSKGTLPDPSNSSAFISSLRSNLGNNDIIVPLGFWMLHKDLEKGLGDISKIKASSSSTTSEGSILDNIVDFFKGDSFLGSLAQAILKYKAASAGVTAATTAATTAGTAGTVAAGVTAGTVATVATAAVLGAATIYGVIDGVAHDAENIAAAEERAYEAAIEKGKSEASATLSADIAGNAVHYDPDGTDFLVNSNQYMQIGGILSRLKEGSDVQKTLESIYKVDGDQVERALEAAGVDLDQYTTTNIFGKEKVKVDFDTLDERTQIQLLEDYVGAYDDYLSTFKKDQYDTVLDYIETQKEQILEKYIIDSEAAGRNVDAMRAFRDIPDDYGAVSTQSTPTVQSMSGTAAGNYGRIPVPAPSYLLEGTETVVEASETLGENVSNGFTEGLKKAGKTKGGFRDYWVDEMGEFIEDSKNILAVHSPSGVFEEIGKNVVEGFKLGLSNKVKNDSLKEWVNNSKNSLKGIFSKENDDISESKEFAVISSSFDDSRIRERISILTESVNNLGNKLDCIYNVIPSGTPIIAGYGNSSIDATGNEVKQG